MQPTTTHDLLLEHFSHLGTTLFQMQQLGAICSDYLESTSVHLEQREKVATNTTKLGIVMDLLLQSVARHEQVLDNLYVKLYEKTKEEEKRGNEHGKV